MDFATKAFVNEQYQNSSRLDIRIRLHEKYSTNPKDWHEWVFDELDLSPEKRVIEFGCGSGALWAKNKSRLPGVCKELILTDYSEGMVATVKQNIGDLAMVHYKQMDIQSVEYAADSFDIVVANHMLYHVPDLERALSEVRRILTSDGVFYAATNGHNHMEEIYDLAAEFDPAISFVKPRNSLQFGLETGESLLKKHFHSVKCIRYPSNLKISNAQDLADYIFSMGTNLKETFLNKEKYDEFISFLESKKDEDGAIHITKDSGMFVCTDPRIYFPGDKA